MKQIVFILATFVYYIEIASAHELGMAHGHTQMITESELLGAIAFAVALLFVVRTFSQRMTKRNQR